jgi:uronate dehydrogenase
MTGRRVVVTGAVGTVGKALLRGLGDRFEVTGVDVRRPAEPIEGRPVRRIDVHRTRGARKAVEGADVVVHLAAAAQLRTPWPTVRRRNLGMTWAVLEASVTAGASRVILASTNHVVGGYERDEPYRSVVAGRIEGLDPVELPRLGAGAPLRPDSPYAVGKAMDEAAGRYFAEQHELSVIALRIGTVRPDDHPEEQRHLATFLSHRDLVELVERCIDAPPSVRFGVFYGVSANTWRIWDIDEARDVVGYLPRDDAEAMRSQLPGGR